MDANQQQGILCITDLPDESRPSVQYLPASKAKKMLGSECSLLIYDAFTGFNPDAFGALSGTLVGGGLFVLLAPELTGWQGFLDPDKARISIYPYEISQVSGRYLQRLAGVLAEDDNLVLWQESQGLGGKPALWDHLTIEVSTDADAEIQLTEDQSQAIAAVMHVSTGHRRRPVVLVSDRGRGKSTALGIAAARLIKKGLKRVLVTAPGQASIDILMRQAQGHLSPSELARISYLPPDEICRLQPDADLLLVDEAAALPVPVLKTLLDRYARLVLATTIHGYEGSGRGFSVRFKAYLNAKTPQWRQVHLSQPVRWAADDPVEALTFRALMLDAEVVDLIDRPEPLIEQAVIEQLDRDQLLNDEPLLSQIFGLLVLAHYQTRPTDLRNLLDGPGLSVWVVRHQSTLLATALVSLEGGFDQEMSTAVFEARRRPQGHLIPQSLSVHAGFKAATELKYARVMRIAVHPDAQRRSIGSRLLDAIEQQAWDRGIDLLGASFGATAGLLQFWMKSGLETVRLGNRKDVASGEYSAIHLKPITEAGLSLFRQLRAQFSEHLPYLLADQYGQLDSRLVQQLLRDNQANVLSDKDRADLDAFVQGHRDYAGAMVALGRLTRLSGSDNQLGSLHLVDLSVLIKRVLQQRPWAEIARQEGLTGRGEVIQSLRTSARRMLSELSG